MVYFVSFANCRIGESSSSTCNVPVYGYLSFIAKIKRIQKPTICLEEKTVKLKMLQKTSKLNRKKQKHITIGAAFLPFSLGGDELTVFGSS